MILKTFEICLMKILLVITISIFLFLTVYSFFYSYVNVITPISDEDIVKVSDSGVLHVVSIAVVFLLIYLFHKRKDFDLSFDTKGFALIMSGVGCICALSWALTTNLVPEYDQLFICDAAVQFNAGDFSALEETGGYVAMYRQQLGIITLLRLMFLIFGDYNYTSFRGLAALAVFGIVYFSYDIASILSNHNKKIEIATCLLVFFCLPIYFYTPFIYGDLVSVVLILIMESVYLRLSKGVTIDKLIVLMLICALAILVRQNSVIFGIAMIGISLFKLIFEQENRFKNIIPVIFIGGGIILSGFITQTIYANHIKDDVKPMPSILWIAMGTNVDQTVYGELKAGWYNGTNKAIFLEKNGDVKIASDIAQNTIEEFYKKCKDNPSFARRFYLLKITSQWEAGNYQSLAMNNKFDVKGSWAKSLVYENQVVWNFIETFMKEYQFLIYCGVLIYLIFELFDTKNVSPIEDYVGIVTILGGFLFSIIWEAKARYMFPYFVLMLPYAMLGCFRLVELKKKAYA